MAPNGTQYFESAAITVDHNPHRRLVLKGVAAAGAGVLAISLPARWTRPIVEAVIVPAHAAASAAATSTSNTSTTTEAPTSTIVGG